MGWAATRAPTRRRPGGRLGLSVAGDAPPRSVLAIVRACPRSTTGLNLSVIVNDGGANEAGTTPGDALEGESLVPARRRSRDALRCRSRDRRFPPIGLPIQRCRSAVDRADVAMRATPSSDGQVDLIRDVLTDITEVSGIIDVGDLACGAASIAVATPVCRIHPSTAAARPLAFGARRPPTRPRRATELPAGSRATPTTCRRDRSACRARPTLRPGRDPRSPCRWALHRHDRRGSAGAGSCGGGSAPRRSTS